MMLIDKLMVLFVLVLFAVVILFILDRTGKPEVAKMAHMSTLIILFAVFVTLLTGLVDNIVTAFHIMN
ncbi:MAG: hypothetical protein ACRKFN_11540 [Desulfitobacterium sp.]